MSSEEADAPPPVRQSVLRRTFGRSSTTAPQVSGYEDHFSLQAPTTVVRFQDSKSAARVIYNEGSQLVLEEQYDRETKKRHISIKQMEEESSGSLSILRGTYTTVGFFFAGFLVAFSLQIILFVICDLAINAGYTGLQSATWGWAMGIIFSFPLLIHGLSLANMLAGFFILDLWRGHPLFKKFILAGVRSEIVEWIFLVGFLLAPFAVMGACLVAKTDDWWQITSLYWFASVFAFYLIFITSVTFYESRVFLNVAFRSQDGSPMDRFLASLMLRKKHSLSGYSRTTYASFGSPEAAMNIDPSAERQYVVKGSLQENQRSIYSRFTQLSFVQGVLYETQESFPQRMFSVDDITGKRPYETSYSWGLERHFCKPRKTRYIGILRGPGAITSTQFKSSIACAFVGVFLLYFLIAGILTYTGFKWSFVGLILVVLILLSLPFCLRPCILQGQLGRLRALKQEWKQRGSVVLDPNAIPADLMEQNNIEDDVKTANNVTSPPDVEADANKTEIKEEPVATDDTKHKGSLTPTAVVGERIEHVISKVKKRVGFDDHKNETYSFETEWKGFSKAKTDMSMGVYNVSEKYRITQPTKGFIIFSLLAELVIFILYPTLALYMIESWQLATLYLALALMSTFRHFTNSEALLQETGKLHSADNKTSSEAATWESESRLSQIAGTLSRGKAYQAWRVIFWIFALGLFGLGGMAVTTKTESSWNNGFTPVNDFYYDPVDSLHYATCALEKNVGGNIPLTLADYTLLSTQTYRSPDVAPAELEQWFGIDVVVEHPEIVEEFRKDEFPVVPVTYKLFTGTGEESQYAVVSIRGSQNAWDFLADGQLWGSVIFMQVVRAFLPFGEMWTPIIDEMIVVLSAIQSGTLGKLSFYRSTTEFAKYLKASGNYTSIVFTGHSLGGGLGIISGAQAEVQAVAISGPNALLSRKRFDVTAENLERFTFNVLPDMDPVAMIDDPVKNIQNIKCTAPPSKIGACHQVTRSLCEILYTCGSGPRPVICECVTLFGYPEPIPMANATRTFAEACPADDA